MNKTFQVFLRDLKIARRDSMALLIIVMPIILAIGISLFTPNLNDTTVNLAMLKGDEDSINYMRQFAKVELFVNKEEIITRVNKRDNIVGLIPNGHVFDIVLQGDEAEIIEEFASVLTALYELDSSIDKTTATIYSFGHTVPPTKTMLVNMLILITVMLAGMLIAISIVGEKTDNTISAINVTPTSQIGFIVGKSMMSGIIAMISIIVALFITGYYDVNFLMIIVIGLTSLIISIVIGFAEGLVSDDVIEATANVKMVTLPAVASIAGYELLADKWQWTMYWSPFYWSYKANQLILTKSADWQTVLFCAFMVFVLSTLVFIALKSKIRRGLS